MDKFLQINVGRSRSAQDLYATAATTEADVVLISEQYKTATDEDGHFSDLRRNAALIFAGNTRNLDAIGPNTDNGFRRIESMSIRIYSSYWSPNSSISEFEDFIDKLLTSIRASAIPTIVAGDFNSYSPE